MRVALVHDYLNQYGGAEKVLEAFTELFPYAPIHTLIYDPKQMHGNFSDKDIRPSFLQKIPFAKSKHRLFPLFMPMAVEQFDFSDYDLVLSDSASYAKGVITRPETLHVCYCHTPTRYAWDDSHKYIQEFGFPGMVKKLIPFFMNYIRLWDREAAMRVDKFICNSKFVAQRIKKYYNQDAEIIYPPVDTTLFSPLESPSKTDEYFLMVGRLLPYKRFDLAVQAFNQLGKRLIIVGDGPERKKLQKMARDNIRFLGEVPNQQLREFYQHCQAFIFPQEEDFGIVAIEAMAAGKPIIAYKGGGVLESVEEGKTGLFFNQQSSESLTNAIKEFKSKDFDSQQICNHALKFDKRKFKKKIKDFVERSWEEHRKNLES